MAWTVDTDMKMDSIEAKADGWFGQIYAAVCSAVNSIACGMFH